ncbi:MAG: AraC family transcriptional regulator [Saprospiraceae bacterium]|nr:AraC family transcriptional regulator [Saprospiraceae bacterium]
MELPKNFYRARKLETMVENQTSYTMNHAAMHVFETHQTAESVLLQFDQPVLASMIKGKKIMHLRDKQSFDFLPGESLILPSNEVMCIDFPQAKVQDPTQCLAMAISEEMIFKVISIMNDTMPRADEREWDFMDYNFHFTNDNGIYQIIQKLLFLFTEDHPSKDVFVDFTLKELIIRILQANTRKVYLDKSDQICSNNRIAFVVRYIQENLSQPLTIELLSQKACMSESNFHRVFKNEMGLSPVEFINNERIQLALRLLKDPSRKIKDVFMECGFESRSYFNRVFKKHILESPKEYQNKVIS